MNITSWNLNGIKAAWSHVIPFNFSNIYADIYCFQETKLQHPVEIIESQGTGAFSLVIQTRRHIRERQSIRGFGYDGTEIYMVRAGDFVTGEKIGQYSFHALARMFMKWNMVLIGYRQLNNDGTYSDPILNPKIGDTSDALGLKKNDYLIVIAEVPDC